MSTPISEPSVKDQKLSEVIAEYLHEIDAGQRPVRQEFLAKHPAWPSS